jgi:polygalacturonase
MGKRLKTPSQNFNIRNCSMKYGHGGVVLGSEMSGGINNIMIEKCQFLETDKGLRIKTRRGRGKDGVLASITVKDVDMKRVKIPFVVNCYYFCDPDGKTEYVYTKEALPLDDRIPEIKNMVFENIKCKEAEIAAGFIYGLPEKKVENLTFKNIYIDFAENCIPDTPAMMSFIEKETKGGFFIANAKNITFENVEVNGYTGEKIRLLNSENIEFRGENN